MAAGPTREQVSNALRVAASKFANELKAAAKARVHAPQVPVFAGDVSFRMTDFAARNAERAQRDAYNASLTDRTVSGVVTAEQPLQVIYGEAIVAPAYVALLTSGDRDQYKHLAAVWAAHECDAIVDVYINGESIGSLDSNGWVTSGRWVSSETSTEAETTTVSSGAFTVSNTVAAFHSATYPDTPGDVSGREYLQADQVTVSGSTIPIIDSPLPLDEAMRHGAELLRRAALLAATRTAAATTPAVQGVGEAAAVAATAAVAAETTALRRRRRSAVRPRAETHRHARRR